MRTASAKIDSRSARARLAPRSDPYNFTIAPRRMLGYVRPAVGAGRWVAIVQIGRGPSGSALRRQGEVGLADDIGPADGVGVLSFAQALGKAAVWQPGDTSRSGHITVRAAVDSYLKAKRAADGERSEQDARQKLRAHVLCETPEGRPIPGREGLGARAVGSLTLTELREWRDELADGRSRATVNRILANFRAALNHAYADEANGIETDSPWRRLEAFGDTGNAREDHFSEPEVERLIRVARKQDERFAELVAAAFYSGARYGELAALDVRHLDAARRSITIPSGKTGARVTTLTEEAARWFAAIAGDRGPREPLLSPGEGRRWARSSQCRPMRLALDAAGLPRSASFYTLRHSYISRAIERGMPLTLLAENVGTSLVMIEKNYAHMLARSRRELVEKTAPRLRLVAGAKRA